MRAAPPIPSVTRFLARFPFLSHAASLRSLHTNEEGSVSLQSDTLRVLAELLGMPDDDALPRLHDLQATQPWLGEAIAEVESLPLAEWQAECTRLFISGHPKTVCPPFASAYREGRMCGAAAEELSGLYARIGLEASSVPPDYLGAMLECAAYLLESEGETGEHWHELWDGQLAPWVPAFAEDLRRHSALELYRAMGEQLSELFPPTADA